MKNTRWKADEMEMAINFRAMRCAWVFLILSLIIWCIADLITTGELPSIPLILESASSAIFFLMKLGLTRKMTKPEQDDDEE